MFLTVSAYDAAERAAEETACNRAIEASKPGTFVIRGYPTRIRRDEDLWRFVDVMHELGEEPSYRQALGGLTEDEFALFREATEGVAAMTRARFGRVMVPKGSLVRAFISYRHIRMISDPATTTVFEFGSGSGYLGALLGLAGYSYAATEIAHGFYLAQNALWTHLFGDRVVELATDPRSFGDIRRLPQGTILHVPWWKFTVPDADRIAFPADVVTANHALCEMHDTAFKYALRLGLRMLGGPDGIKYFFIEGPGADDLRNRQQMHEGFQAAGYSPVFLDFPIEIFAPTRHGAALHESAPAAPEPSNKPTGLGRLFGKTKPSVAPAPAQPVSKVAGRIGRGRERLAALPRVPFEAVRAYQQEILGGAPLFTEDEQLLRFAYGRDDW